MTQSDRERFNSFDLDEGFDYGVQSGGTSRRVRRRLFALKIRQLGFSCIAKLPIPPKSQLASTFGRHQATDSQAHPSSRQTTLQSRPGMSDKWLEFPVPGASIYELGSISTAVVNTSRGKPVIRPISRSHMSKRYRNKRAPRGISRALLLGLSLGIFGIPILPVTAANSDINFKDDVLPALKSRCFKCHGPDKQKSDLRLDTLSIDLIKDRPAAETWHDVLNALNLGEMPPEDEPQFSDAERKLVIRWLTKKIRQAAEAQREAGSGVVLRRLNRAEYNNTLRDLLGIDDDYARNLPPEAVSEEGFKNNGSALRMSELQFEYYLKAAREALAQVIVTHPEPEVFQYETNQTVADKGKGHWSNELGRHGTFVVRMEEYPEQGDFVVRVRARADLKEGKGYPQLAVSVGFRSDVHAPSRDFPAIDITSDETRTYEFRGRMEQFPLPSKTQSKYPGLLIWARNAYHDGIEPGKPQRESKIVKGKKRKGAIVYPVDPSFPKITVESVELVGPIFKHWPPEHHRRILFDSPLRQTDESAYARQVLTRFISRAFRRPVGDAEVTPFFRYFENVLTGAESLEVAMREALAMVLISTDFLYLVEPSVPGKKRPLNNHELASRLSYFLWGTMPDQDLVTAAFEGGLTEPQAIKKQVQRLLDSDRSQNFIDQFTDQWLDLGAIDRVAVNPEFYPDFDNRLKPHLREETRQFFTEILRHDLSALNLLDSKFAMLNEPLARHYGLSGPRGSGFERVPLKAKDRRGGLLTQGSVLLGNSTGEDSHPVMRAVWLRERLLDDPPPPPPPNVPTLDAEDPNFAKLSVRRQLEIHRKDPACADCHRGIDPWGIALEEFGADGLLRDRILRKDRNGKRQRDIHVAINSNATLPDGHPVTGLNDLKAYLLQKKSGQFARTVVSRMLAYALGRSLELGDEETINRLTERFVAGGYNLRQLIEQIAVCDPFMTK